MLALALLAGCRETRGVRWEIAFVDPGLRTRAVIVGAEVRRGSCLEDGEVVYAEEFAIGSGAPMVPILGGGAHAFAAIARDASCVEIARGCVEVVLPTDADRLVRTDLAGTGTTAPICDACTAGVCEGPPDAGPIDAGQDGGLDGGDVDAGPPGPDAPRLLHPWNGFVTGRTRQPRFVWERAPGATRYEVQLETECATPCAFPAGAAPIRSDASTTTGVWTFVPSAAIVPGPSRVHWRVRSCDASTCGRWSSDVRWMDVDRERHDVDGDGDGDLVIGAPTEDRGGTEAGAVYVVLGSATGLDGAATALALASEAGAWLGSAIDVGDVNGDGLADAVIGAEEADAGGSSEAGRLLIVPGRAGGGLDVAGMRAIGAPDPIATSYFGQSVAIVDDVNGDGLRDILVGASRDDAAGRAYLFHGARGAALIDPTPAMRFVDTDAQGELGHTVAGAGDVDGDGRPDLLIGEPFANVASHGSRGRVHLVRASALEPIDGPADSRAYFGFSLAGLGDVDGDGLSDVAIGAPYADPGGDEGNEGELLVHRGSPTGVDPTPLARLTTSEGYNGAHAGWSVAAGDLDGDGDVDLVVPQPAIDADTVNIDRGRVVVYRGDGAGGFTEAGILYCGIDERNLEFGRSIAVLDADGDGQGEVIGGAHRHAAEVGRVFWFSDPLTTATRDAIEAPVTTSTARFGWALPGSVGRLLEPPL